MTLTTRTTNLLDAAGPVAPTAQTAHGWSRRTMVSLCAAATLSWGMAASQALAQGQPQRGGTVIAALDPGAIASFNTHMTSLTSSLFIADVWADGLMTYDRVGNRIPRMATEWTVSPDGLVYTFKLRQGVKWSDGKPFTSADVLFTLNNFAKYNTYLGKLNPMVDKAETPDDHTFVLKLKEPLTATLDLFDKEVFPLLPKHVYEGSADMTTHPANRAPVGLGPFKFESWESGRSITFVRNPHYWDKPKPYLDSVVFALIPDAQQRLNAMTRGEIQWFRPEASQVGTAKAGEKAGNYKVVRIVNNAPERAVVDFNMRKPPFNDVKVRKALFMAIDRERIVADAYQGLASTVKNAIPVQFKQLHDPSVDFDKMYPYDPKKAAALLDEAGLTMKDGKRLTLEVAYISRPPYDAVAKVVQSNWNAVGVEVKMSGLDPQIWIDKVYKKNEFDTSIISLTGRTNPVLGVDRSYLCNEKNLPFVNPTGYCNPEMDKAVAEAAAAPLDKQRGFYKRYAEIHARDLNQLILVSQQMNEVVTNKLDGLDAQFNFSYNTHPNWAEAWYRK